MADEGKRRRVRPSNWWEVQENENGNGNGEVDVSSQSTANAQSPSPNINTLGGGIAKKKARPWVPAGMSVPSEKKRGRSSLGPGSGIAKQNGENDEGQGNIEVEAEDENSRTRRGRKNTNNTGGILSGHGNTDVVETVTAVSSLAPQKKKGRPAVGVVDRAARNGPSKNAATGSRTKGESKASHTGVEERKRGRSATGNLGTTNNREKKSNGDHIEPEKSKSSRSQKRDPAEPESSAPARKIKKSSKNVEEESEKQSKPSESKKHVKISDVPQTNEPEAGKPKTKKAGPPDNSEFTRKRKDSNTDEQQPQQQTKRRRVEDSQDNRAEREQPEPPSYQHLAAVTRRVTHETIETKWEPLPPGCLDKISDLLIDAQRPVVLQIRDERKKTQASTAIRMISRRLLNRVRKGMPFPKGTRASPEDDFDFEKILDYNRVLENKLTPILHSNDLLEAELRKEEILLESEERYLAELEANAKDEATSRRQAARKAHPLLQFEVDGTQKVLNDDIGIDENEAPSPITLDASKYQDLEGIVKSTDGHVDSIKGNLQQIEGITDAMAKSKASVQAALFSHLDLDQYNDVVLG
ncbi:putative kinetochore protein fta7 protein [Botrytis fragariae]|uniref:Putative kinetochore protein fta7 protein n=1 Tax=Botrytis fragariae TaxID=1964551 RepID=A0A8H6AXB2_9HELO|nr:putative kinetochore protein fta7 protein [Botrytis fragariae]KAF5875308.1 putative kinetochore protein fta7 protein [Botrytis fragariae]